MKNLSLYLSAQVNSEAKSVKAIKKNKEPGINGKIAPNKLRRRKIIESKVTITFLIAFGVCFHALYSLFMKTLSIERDIVFIITKMEKNQILLLFHNGKHFKSLICVINIINGYNTATL